MAYQPIVVHAGELPWTGLAQDEYRFRTIFVGIVIALMTIASIVPFLSLPKPSRQELETVPPRLAKIILEQRAQVKPSEPKPQPTLPPPPPPPTGVERPKPEPRKPLTQAEERARKRVQTQGIGALTGELSALADSSSISSMAPARVTTSGKNTEAATVDTGILTAPGGRATANPGAKPQVHAGAVDTIKLEDNRKESTRALLASKGEVRSGTAREGARSGARGSSGRAEEDVAVVMDKYKALLYTIYNRARRTNPGLKGKIVLVITILPSGEVANVVTKSNELNAPELEAALLARIRQFNFGVSQGGPLTVTVPVEFLPS